MILGIKHSDESPLRVINGLFSTTLKMSASGGKTDLFHGPAKSPLIAKSGHMDGSSKSFINGVHGNCIFTRFYFSRPPIFNAQGVVVS